MRESRIVAVDHVELQAHPRRQQQLVWFYTEVVGLDEVTEAPSESRRLRFRSADLELRYDLVDEPVLDGTDHRVTLLVDSLYEVRQILDEARVGYQTISGLAHTDRIVSLLDPGGNRIALRQAWRPIT
jgi:hypothetical protein